MTGWARRALSKFNSIPVLRSHPFPVQVRLAKDEVFRPYFLIVFSFWIVCLVESIQQLRGQHPDPRFWMLLAVAVTLLGGVKIFRLQSAPPSSVYRADKIEKVMDIIRGRGSVVYHQAAESGLDVDWVMVGPGGVYAIDVKARNAFGSGTIDHRNDHELLLGGKIFDNLPLKRTRSAAARIRERLAKECAIKPLVVFTGDWRINQPDPALEVTVTTARQLEDYLNREPASLTPADISRICSELESLSFANAA